MICAVAGMNADANILINYARQNAQRYLLTYNEDIPCEQLVRRLCDLKQGYTQHGGLRPFGVSFIYAGWDHLRQIQLYQSNPSGNYGGWKATSVGANNASAQSLLKQDYKEDCSLQEVCAMAVKVLSKTMDSTKLSSEKSESPRFCINSVPSIRTILNGHRANLLFFPCQSSSQQWARPRMERSTTTYGVPMRLMRSSGNKDWLRSTTSPRRVRLNRIIPLPVFQLLGNPDLRSISDLPVHTATDNLCVGD